MTPDKNIAWQLRQKDLPGITLAWVTTLSVLPNNHIVFGNCHAGPGQPQIIEIADRGKTPIWTFEHFDIVGNDLTNSVLIDMAQKTNR